MLILLLTFAIMFDFVSVTGNVTVWYLLEYGVTLAMKTNHILQSRIENAEFQLDSKSKCYIVVKSELA